MHDKLSPIFKRRSIRRYEQREIAPSLVRDLLEAAMAAPSACCEDPWRFITVTQRSRLEELAAGLPNGPMLVSAGAGIVVCGDIAAANTQQLSYMLQDCSAAIENMLLAAELLGLGAVWLGVHPREERMAHVRAVCHVPAEITPVSVISIGWPGEAKEARTRYSDAKVHHETW